MSNNSRPVRNNKLETSGPNQQWQQQKQNVSNGTRQDMTGQLVIISGPSGVGKSTICRELAKRLDNVYLNISTTTRPKKNGEQNGREYWFVSPDEFEKKIEAGKFLEYARVFDNLYGTEKDKVFEAIAQGRTVLLEIDVQGAQQVKKLYPESKLIFILPPKHAELAKRIDGRGREDQKEIEKRLDAAGIEIAAGWQYYNKMVINDDLSQAVQEVINIISKQDQLENKND